MSDFIPSFASINLYEFFQSLSSFIHTENKNDNLQKAVTGILNDFRIKSPDDVKPLQLVIIYECCRSILGITPKYAKILSVSSDPGNNKNSYDVEIYDRENVSGTDLTPPYSTGSTHTMTYVIEIDRTNNELKSSAVVTDPQQPNDPPFSRDVCMLFDYNDKTLYDRIVAEFQKKLPDFYNNELKGKITSDIDNKIQENTGTLQRIKKNVNNYMLTEKSINEHIKRLNSNKSKFKGNVVQRAFNYVSNRFSTKKGTVNVTSNGGKKGSSTKKNKRRCSKSNTRYYCRSIRVKRGKNTAQKR